MSLRDLSGIPNKIIGGVEKHAMLLAFGAGAYLRKREQSRDAGEALSYLMDHFTNLGLPTTPGAGGYGALGEALYTLSNMPTLSYKLFQSPHAYTTFVKVGGALWIAGELGIIPSRFGDIGKKVAIGGAAAAIVMPGSGGSNSGSNRSNSGYGY